MLAFRGSIVPHPPFAGQDLRVVAQAAVQPRDRVADLEPGILDGARESVPGAGATEREEVAAGLEDSQALGSPQFAPLLEGQSGGELVDLRCQKRGCRLPAILGLGVILGVAVGP